VCKRLRLSDRDGGDVHRYADAVPQVHWSVVSEMSSEPSRAKDCAATATPALIVVLILGAYLRASAYRSRRSSSSGPLERPTKAPPKSQTATSASNLPEGATGEIVYLSRKVHGMVVRRSDSRHQHRHSRTRSARAGTKTRAPLPLRDMLTGLSNRRNSHARLMKKSFARICPTLRSCPCSWPTSTTSRCTREDQLRKRTPPPLTSFSSGFLRRFFS